MLQVYHDDLFYFILGSKNLHEPELLEFKKVHILINYLPFPPFTDTFSVTALDTMSTITKTEAKIFTTNTTMVRGKN